MKKLLSWIGQNPIVLVILVGILVVWLIHWFIYMPLISAFLLSGGFALAGTVIVLSKQKPEYYVVYGILTFVVAGLIGTGAILWLWPNFLASIISIAFP